MIVLFIVLRAGRWSGGKHDMRRQRRAALATGGGKDRLQQAARSLSSINGGIDSPSHLRPHSGSHFCQQSQANYPQG